MSRLSAAQVRATDARVRVLRCLAGQKVPVTLDDVCAASGICRQYDPATVWRALDLLEKMQVVRQIRLSDRHVYFALNAPGNSCDYLVCRNCGSVADLPALAPMVELEYQLAAARGFEISHHELEIYGTCSDCRPVDK